MPCSERPDCGSQVRATARRGDAPPFEALMSSTYALVDGAPRLTVYQQTTVTH